MEENNKGKGKQFLVIGTGLPRTGTSSLKFALEMLLPGKCHHMTDAIRYHGNEWKDILGGKTSDEEFKNFFTSNCYVAAVDAPFCYIYERALELFPHAKVIHTVRGSDGWVRSVSNTIFHAFDFEFPGSVFGMFGLFSSYLGEKPQGLLEALLANPVDVEFRKAIRDGRGNEFFDEWTNEVERKVSRDRLLKFDVREGWEPLCRFLNVSQPDLPFPKCNSTAEVKERLANHRRRSWLLLYEIISLPVLFYYAWVKWMGR